MTRRLNRRCRAYQQHFAVESSARARARYFVIGARVGDAQRLRALLRGVNP